MKFKTEIFEQFDKKWALLTAGRKDDFNMMTISWGGLGTLWNRPVATVYVRTSRYTHDFMDKEDYFTVSFYPEEYRKILGVLGSKSGRDIDKIRDSGLTAIEARESVTFREADITLLCKKLYKQQMDIKAIPEYIARENYAEAAIHDMYIGEVIDIIIKEETR